MRLDRETVARASRTPVPISTWIQFDMNNLDAASATELCTQLRANDVRLPARAEGRTPRHTETWVTCRFLATICGANLLQFPLRAEPRDRPDLVLTTPSGQTGIEITEVVPHDKAKVGAYSGHKRIDAWRFIPRYRVTDPPRSRADIEKIARGQTRDFPQMGHLIVRDWVEAMVDCVSRKAAKFTKPGFAKYPNNWLLIWDNWGVLERDVRVAARNLVQQVCEHDRGTPFDRVFVLRPRNIWEFSANNAVVVKHTIPETWRGFSATPDDP